MRPKVLIALNTAWNLVNFRSGLICALLDSGYEVVTVAPPDEYVPRLEALGCRFVPLPMDNNGTNPGRDLLLLFHYYRVLRRERPAIFLGYTVKPNVYGSLSAHCLGIPVINNIAGLGTVFIKNTWLTSLVRGLYRLALSRSTKVFFQNENDRQLFVSSGLVAEAVTERLPGSGVDLVKFVPVPLPGKSPFRFLMIGRMLWDKGVREFVEAARILQRRSDSTDFCLLGFMDVRNPAAVPVKQMDAWVGEGTVRYLGVSDSVREEIAQADCIVLPSYREGIPRTLLEAAAMARPVVTTDTPGCRDVVEDGVTGFICKARDSADLAQKMENILDMKHHERVQMGRRARMKIEKDFDEQIVIGTYTEAIETALRE